MTASYALVQTAVVIACGLGLASPAYPQAPQDARVVAAPADDAEAALVASGDHQALGTLLDSRALVAFGRGERRLAADLWRRSLAAFEAAGDEAAQARVIYGASFADRDDPAAVLASLERALGLARRSGAVELEGQILHRRGDEAFLQGRYVEAIHDVERAVRLLEQAGTPARLARALTSLGRVYRVHGQYDRALEIYRRGLALHETTNDQRGIAQSLNALATVLRHLGRRDEALRAARRAEGLLHDDRTGARALTLNTVAGLLNELGRTAESLVAVDAGLAAAPSPNDIALLHASRAVLLTKLGRNHDANTAAAAARAALDRQEVRGAANPALVMAHLANARATFGDRTTALEESALAVALIDEERARTLPQDALRAGFDETTQWVYGQHVRLLAAAGRAGEALEAAERARARAFADLLATRQIVGPDAAAATTSGAGVATVARPVAIAAIIAQAARLDSTFLAYRVHDEETWVWAVTSAGVVHSARVPVTLRRLTALVRDAGAMSARPGVYRDLYDLLVAPMTANLPRGTGARLTIIPHGPLFQLSFAALKAPHGRYLVEDFRIHYAPSVGVLVTTAVQRPVAGPARGFLVTADPTLPAALRASGGLARLPGALAEGRLVAAAGGVPQEAVLERAAATEGRVRALAGGRRVLHFATHAVVSDSQPLDSYLALAAGGSGHEDDGRLTAEEVYTLRLDADLVVLSGCRTAAGRPTGDGITGLARAFFYAGTPALVATLWELPDAAGRAVLPRFYRHWQQHGDKAAALRNAQVTFLQDLRAGRISVNTPAGTFILPETPGLWAGLVLIGEP